MTTIPKKLVVGVSGASGAPYAWRLLEFLSGPGRAAGVETHVVFTKYGRMCWEDEVGVDFEKYGFPRYGASDMTAPFASGSAGFDAMIVIPCSAGQVGRIAHGISADLIGRAADVMLKERRKLVLVMRESPLSLIHLRNMTTLVEAGAVVMPASPSFYSQPDSLNAVLDTVVARALDSIGVPHDLTTRWAGRPENRDGVTRQGDS